MSIDEVAGTLNAPLHTVVKKTNKNLSTMSRFKIQPLTIFQAKHDLLYHPVT